MVHPSGCISSGCQFLYLYDDEETGRRFMGCMNKVFRGEIDQELFEQAERTRHGFGGVKMTGLPLPQCRASVERAYDGYTEAFECVNPGFFTKPLRGRLRRRVRPPRRAVTPPSGSRRRSIGGY